MRADGERDDRELAEVALLHLWDSATAHLLHVVGERVDLLREEGLTEFRGEVVTSPWTAVPWAYVLVDEGVAGVRAVAVVHRVDEGCFHRDGVLVPRTGARHGSGRPYSFGVREVVRAAGSGSDVLRAFAREVAAVLRAAEHAAEELRRHVKGDK